MAKALIELILRAVRHVALGAAVLALLVAASPARAQDMALAELPPQAGVSDGGTDDQASTSLTPAVLQAYVARQQARQGFNIFGDAPQPQLTSAMVLAYAQAHLRNDALSAIDSAAAPAPLLASFSSGEVDDAAAASANPSITPDMLEQYAHDAFVPTVKKVRRANDEKLCLSKAIYHEARGESDNGQWAVANVIINRALSNRFPSTMCGVIYQNANQGRYRCQFSFACDGEPDIATERQAWMKANRIAAAAYSDFQQGRRPGIVPSNALYYHTASVSTDWGFRRVAQIGAHVFYSPM